ncbi:MAG TPA: lysylphosphatidylglycerol synthase transmembrane domain-containing protein [Gaiellaceae bacterium]
MSGRRILIIGLSLATLGAGFVLLRQAGGSTLHEFARLNWGLLAAGFVICAGVQPLRALAWSSTVRSPVGFRAIYASSSIGSFLDTVLPGRLGEASKVAVLKVASGSRWPGFSRAGGSLLCAHLLEMISFAVLGAAATLFLPVPLWARWTVLGGIAGASAGIALATVVHRRFGRRLPQGLTLFLAGAAAPRHVLLRAGSILLVTWLARWFGIMFCLHAVGIHLGIGAALLYMIVTGLANTAPLLPGNVGVYQAAALGALALVGYSGSHAVVASLLTPLIVTLATASAALVGLALYGRHFTKLSRAALQPGKA